MEKLDTSTEILKQLANSLGYRDFLQAAFSFCKENNPKFSYAYFAKKAGFSSRNFVRDIVIGDKRLTLESAIKFSKGLGLTGASKKYFLLLVAREEKGANADGLSPELIQSRLQRIRFQLAAKVDSKNQSKKKTSELYRFNDWPVVYAALGKVGVGVPLSEVSKRTRIRQEVCKNILEEMISAKVVELKAGCYLAPDFHVILKSQKDKSSFQRFFLHCLAEAKRSAQTNFESNDALFLTSVASIKASRAADFKEKLRDLILGFTEEIEDSDGDDVVSLTVAMVPKSATL